MRHLSPVTKRLALAVLCVLVTLSVSGCGSSSVKGTVKYNGQPLNGGQVIFMDAEGHVTQPAYIQSDGTYVATNVPTGTMKVIVDNPPPPGYGKPDPKANPDDPETKAFAEAAAKYMPIPSKFKDPEKSGKTFEVKRGANEFNIELDGPLDSPGQNKPNTEPPRQK